MSFPTQTRPHRYCNCRAGCHPAHFSLKLFQKMGDSFRTKTNYPALILALLSQSRQLINSKTRTLLSIAGPSHLITIHDDFALREDTQSKLFFHAVFTDQVDHSGFNYIHPFRNQFLIRKKKPKQQLFLSRFVRKLRLSIPLLKATRCSEQDFLPVRDFGELLGNLCKMCREPRHYF